MRKLRWMTLGLALVSLAGCGWFGEWGGGPSAGQSSPYQAHRPGDPP